jgi:K+-sensing histidine kinase KdpD
VTVERQGREVLGLAGDEPREVGLSICRKLVEAMKGELKVETGPSGTRFYFTLELPPVDSGAMLGG